MDRYTFRGRRVNNGNWAYGTLVFTDTVAKMYKVVCTIHETQELLREGDKDGYKV